MVEVIEEIGAPALRLAIMELQRAGWVIIWFYLSHRRRRPLFGAGVRRHSHRLSGGLPHRKDAEGIVASSPRTRTVCNPGRSKRSSRRTRRSPNDWRDCDAADRWRRVCRSVARPPQRLDAPQLRFATDREIVEIIFLPHQTPTNGAPLISGNINGGSLRHLVVGFTFKVLFDRAGGGKGQDIGDADRPEAAHREQMVAGGKLQIDQRRLAALAALDRESAGVHQTKRHVRPLFT